VRARFFENKQLPNDFAWFNNPKAPEKFDEEGVTDKDRVYQAYKSNMFNRETAKDRIKEVKEERVHFQEEERDATLKRKNNIYYSDLFDR